MSNTTNLPKTAEVDVNVPSIVDEALAPSAEVTVRSPQGETSSAGSGAGHSAEATPAAAPQPIAAPVSLAPAPVIVDYRTRRPVELPDRLRKLMDSESAATAKALLRHPPILAGQSLDHYFDLVEAALLDHRPFTYDEIALVVQVANEEWKIFTFGEIQKWLLNAAIGRALVDEINDRDEGRTEGRQTPMREYRRVVFGAIAGDPVMLEQLENKLGVGCLGFSAYTAAHIAEDIRAHIFADATISAAVRRHNSAIQQLAKLAERRFDRIRTKKPTADDLRALKANLALEEHCRLFMDRTRYPDKASTERAAQGDEAGSGVQNPTAPARMSGQT